MICYSIHQGNNFKLNFFHNLFDGKIGIRYFITIMEPVLYFKDISASIDYIVVQVNYCDLEQARIDMLTHLRLHACACRQRIIARANDATIYYIW